MSERGTYRTIAAELESAIGRGDYQAGSLLPSEPELAREYAVARNTVRAALELLDASGLIEVRPGYGRLVKGLANGDVATNAYERVALAIRGRVTSGQYKPRQPLPPIREFQVEFDVSRNTVRRAYRLLEDQGVIVVKHGAGAFAVGDSKQTPRPVR